MNALMASLFFVYRYVWHFFLGFFKFLWEGLTKLRGPWEFVGFMLYFTLTWWFRSGQLAYQDTRFWMQGRSA